MDRPRPPNLHELDLEASTSGEGISPRTTESSGESESPDFEDIQLPNTIQNPQFPEVRRLPSAVELSRIETYRLQHRSTVGSATGPAPQDQWLPFGGGKPYPPQLPDPDEYVVEFTGEDDPLHPQNWPSWKK